MPRYSIKTDGNGLTAIITRNSDGATAFLQGDDAAILLAELTNADNWTDDDVCDQYANLFVPTGLPRLTDKKGD
jgi:hypothetical protein